MSEHIFPNDTPFSLISCEDAFNLLTKKEKLYAHYLSKACWFGGLIVLAQTSLESPLIFILLHKLFKNQSPEELKQVALQCGLSEEDYTAFLLYACGIFVNMGNYRGFGDLKFIPNLPKEKFEKLLIASKFAKQDRQYMDSLLSRCLEKIYSLEETDLHLGFPEIGTTTYLSKNICKDEQEEIKKYFAERKLEFWNTRLFKTHTETGKNCYEVRLASVLETDDEFKKNYSEETYGENMFRFTRGDYSKLLDLVNKYLLQSKEYSANENQKQMIQNYVKSFHSGSVDAHKDGSRFWIKDKGPMVESYIGFIETYRDPAGVRAEWEGFVAMVNKPQSDKFQKLVDNAEKYIAMLPWPKEYEKDTFLRPDFTSLDILTFGASGIPIGINIPNYDEITQSEGFKNVSLGNVIRVPPSKPPNFLCQEDQDLMMSTIVPAMEIIVGLHELLGHGSGKIFEKKKDGTFNFDIDNVLHLETNEKVTSWYNEGESYYGKFGSLSSAYEETRADSVALHLSTVPEILKIFGYEGTEAEKVMYAVWLSTASGLQSLIWYDPKSQVWLQAHCQTHYVLMRVFLEAGEGFLTIERTIGDDGEPDLLFRLDRTKILSVGMPALGRFLRRVQLYKTTADAASAEKMYNAYAAVTNDGDHPFLEYRDIVVARKKPRRFEVQVNTSLDGDDVKIVNYPATAEGMIESWVGHMDGENVYEILEELWSKDRHHFQ